MKIKKGMEEDYKKGYNNNLDPYGHACFVFAEKWASLLENEIDKGDDVMQTIIDKANETCDVADKYAGGITGFMYGMGVNILSQCWEYGEYLRKWHNKEYDYDGEGVVNPAILTVKGE